MGIRDTYDHAGEGLKGKCCSNVVLLKKKQEKILLFCLLIQILLLHYIQKNFWHTFFLLVFSSPESFRFMHSTYCCNLQQPSHFVTTVTFCNQIVAICNKKPDAFCSKRLPHFARNSSRIL